MYNVYIFFNNCFGTWLDTHVIMCTILLSTINIWFSCPGISLLYRMIKIVKTSWPSVKKYHRLQLNADFGSEVSSPYPGQVFKTTTSGSDRSKSSDWPQLLSLRRICLTQTLIETKIIHYCIKMDWLHVWFFPFSCNSS